MNDLSKLSRIFSFHGSRIIFARFEKKKRKEKKIHKYLSLGSVDSFSLIPHESTVFTSRRTPTVYTCHTLYTARLYFSASERSWESTRRRARDGSMDGLTNFRKSRRKFGGERARFRFRWGWGQDRVRSGQKTARWKWKSQRQERCAPASVVWSSFLRPGG